ncbi:MAG: SURF1 family protein [Pseudomonadota bacterium]
MRISTIILIACIVIGFAFLCTLGFWQVQRLAWKEALIARVEANRTSDPIAFDAMADRLKAGKDIEYRPVRVAGSFLHKYEAHFFVTQNGRPGYHVYTPLRRDNGQIVFVNRGFVPIDLKDPSARPGGQIEGRQEIAGLARTAPPAKPNSFVPNNDLAKNIYYWKSLNQMLGQMPDKAGNAALFFVDAGPNTVPGGWPQGGATRISFPNSHLQYAATWFGLALTLLGVGGFFLRARAKAHKNKQLQSA